MFNSKLLLLTMLISTSGFAGVSFKQKQSRVKSLLKMGLVSPSFGLESYQRTLEYEKQDLSVENRTKTETNLLAEKIRLQVRLAYDAALKDHKSPELAREEIKSAIEEDLSLAAPEMREELINVAMDMLNNIENGASSVEVDLATVEAEMMKGVVSRKEFLNEDLEMIEHVHGQETLMPVVNLNKDAERSEFSSKEELMESLVSERQSSRWVSTAHQTVSTGAVVRNEGKISIQIKVEFLGATIEAGPTISFSREFSTNASILAEGLNPVILKDGNFDFWKRDTNNEFITKNGKQEKRYVAFFCDAYMKFQTDYVGSGGFKYAGLGVDTNVSKTFQNSVNLQSRRIALPESVANKTMTVKYISELCHGEFKKAHLTNKMTIGQSLDIMMKNVVSGLIFSNPKTKCIDDSQCEGVFKTEVLAVNRPNNVYRCVENTIDKSRFCQLRGQVGQNCPVYENGTRSSSGEREFACNFGLKCTKYESAKQLMNWTWNYAKGKCQK